MVLDSRLKDRAPTPGGSPSRTGRKNRECAPSWEALSSFGLSDDRLMVKVRECAKPGFCGTRRREIILGLGKVLKSLLILVIKFFLLL